MKHLETDATKSLSQVAGFSLPLHKFSPNPFPKSIQFIPQTNQLLPPPRWLLDAGTIWIGKFANAAELETLIGRYDDHFNFLWGDDDTLLLDEQQRLVALAVQVTGDPIVMRENMPPPLVLPVPSFGRHPPAKIAVRTVTSDPLFPKVRYPSGKPYGRQPQPQPPHHRPRF